MVSFTVEPNNEDMQLLKQLIEAGKVCVTQRRQRQNIPFA